MSIQLQNKYSKSQPFHIYYDLQMINNNTGSPNTAPVNFTYQETRNSPFLDCPSNYFMSVIRFQVQTPTLPVFIPQMLLGQSDVNKTAYSITLSYVYNFVDYSFQQYIQYVNYDLPEPAPASLSLSTITSQYYYIFSLQQWVRMINTAFDSAYAGLNALIIAAGGALPSTHPPFCQFDPYSLIMNINADILGYNSALATPIKIFFNSALYSLYSNFEWTFQPLGYNATLGKNFQLNVNNNVFSNVYVVPDTPSWNALQCYQEGSTASLLNPVQSLVFTSGLLPVVNSNVGIPSLNQSGLSSSNGNNSNISPIITDFQVPLSALNRYVPDIQYTPSGEYRLIDLYGDSPLSRFEVSVSWKDTFGILHPLLLGPGQSASMKVMFRRKDFNKSQLFSSV